MNDPILTFDGEYRFLSNFYPSVVELDGDLYPTVENAYQAAKTTDRSMRALFGHIRPGMAKARGRRIPLRPDWEQVKVTVMHNLLRQKFAAGTELGNQLLATGDRKLVEGNTWHDQYWGIDQTGRGYNMLGHLLMLVRWKLKVGMTHATK